MPKLDDIDDIDALIDRAVDTFFVEAPSDEEQALQQEQLDRSASQRAQPPSPKPAEPRSQGPSLEDAVDSLFMGSFQEDDAPPPSLPSTPTSAITSGDDEIDRIIDFAVDTLFVEDPGTAPPETTQVEVKSAEVPTGDQAFRDFVAKQEVARAKPAPPPPRAVPEPPRPKVNYEDAMAREIERHLANTYKETGGSPPGQPSKAAASTPARPKTGPPVSPAVPGPKAPTAGIRPQAKAPLAPVKPPAGKQPVAPPTARATAGPSAPPPAKEPAAPPPRPPVPSGPPGLHRAKAPGGPIGLPPLKAPTAPTRIAPPAPPVKAPAPEKKPVPARVEAPPLRQLQEAILTLEWEISDRSIVILGNELNRIRLRFRDDMTVDFAAVAMKLVLEYISKRMSHAHPESVRFLLEVADFLEGNLGSSEDDPLSGFHHILTRYEMFKSTVRVAEGLQDRVPPDAEDLGIADPPAFGRMVVTQAAVLAKAGESLAQGLANSDDPKNLIRSFRFLVNRAVNRILEGTRQAKTKSKAKGIAPKKRGPVAPTV